MYFKYRICFSGNKLKIDIFLIALITLVFLGSFINNGACNTTNDALNGIVLYEQYCAKCHYSLENTSKAGRRLSRIKSAIQRVPSHESITHLNDQELSAIADVLTQTHH